VLYYFLEQQTPTGWNIILARKSRPRAWKKPIFGRPKMSGINQFQSSIVDRVIIINRVTLIMMIARTFVPLIFFTVSSPERNERDVSELVKIAYIY
jgi:hypothetical protein